MLKGISNGLEVGVEESVERTYAHESWLKGSSS